MFIISLYCKNFFGSSAPEGKVSNGGYVTNDLLPKTVKNNCATRYLAVTSQLFDK